MFKLITCAVVSILSFSAFVSSANSTSKESSTLGAEIGSLSSTRDVKPTTTGITATRTANLIEHVYSVNERETISLKCPIDTSKQQLRTLASSEHDQLSNAGTEEEVYDYSEPMTDERASRAQQLGRSKKQRFPVINWYKDASRIGDGSQMTESFFSARYQADGIYLKIKHVSPKDTGKFKCVIVAENGQNLSSNVISLIVQAQTVAAAAAAATAAAPPTRKPTRKQESAGPAFLNSVRSQPKVFYKQKGSQVRLRCRASGSPRPSIIWYKNGELLSLDDYGITRFVNFVSCVGQ